MTSKPNSVGTRRSFCFPPRLIFLVDITMSFFFLKHSISYSCCGFVPISTYFFSNNLSIIEEYVDGLPIPSFSNSLIN